MDIRITVQFQNGYRLLNRELEVIEITSRLNDFHQCKLVFDSREHGRERLEDFFGTVEVTAEEVELSATRPPRRATLFRGVMIDGDEEHQFYGRSRFTILAASRSLYAMATYRTSEVTTRTAAHFFGQPPFRAVDQPRYLADASAYWLDETELEYARRLAGMQGYLFRELADETVELRTAFSDTVHQLIWGTTDLTAFRTRATLANGHFRGATYQVAEKRDFRFVGVSQPPELSGASALSQRIRHVSPAAPVRESMPAVAGQQLPRVMLSHGPGIFDVNTLRDTLKRESERTWGTAVQVEGDSHHIGLTAGDRIATSSHPEAVYQLPSTQGEFGLIEVLHRYDQEGYRCRFVATPWKNYCAPTAPRAHPVVGPTVAEVIGYADIPGRVIVRFPWMPSTVRPVGVMARLVSPFAGNERGVVFLPEIGDEVLVAFEHGDPDRPYVIGSCWNGRDACPGPAPKRLVTKSGNTIVMDDRDERIEIFSPDGKCLVQLANDVGGRPRLTIHSQGDLALEAPNGTLSINCGKLVERVRGDAAREVDGQLMTAASRSFSMAGNAITMAFEEWLVVGGGALINLGQNRVDCIAREVGIKGTNHVEVHGQMIDLNPPVAAPAATRDEQPPPREAEGGASSPFTPLGSVWHRRPRPAATEPFQSGSN